MSTIERLTRTHADLEAELTVFARMLADTEEILARDAIAVLHEELDAVQAQLERHIANEVSLAERSDFVLGEGLMEDYGVPQHHERMRAAVARLRHAVEMDSPGELGAQFRALVEQFDQYTTAEVEFLRENGAVLYPGGSSG